MDKRSPIWSLQEAKAKFSQVVKLAQSDGPQTITVHGKPVVIIGPVPPGYAAETGAGLVALLAGSPLRKLGQRAIARSRLPARGRPIDL
jgi:prevent-host-death family protein